MKNVKHTLFTATLIILAAFGIASAQDDKLSAKENNSPTDVTEATQEYKTNSAELLQIQQEQLTKAEAKFEELRGLVDEGLVARVELSTNEQALADLRAELEATKKKIAEAEQLLVKIQTEKEEAKKLAAMPKSNVKLVSKSYTLFPSRSNILRYSGAAPFSLAGLAEIRSFFSSTFGRSLPTSAIGQSATHNQFGYNHRNAVDVAVHPDSVEGKTLINYLQTQGIPFLAFRSAIPGVATGPHIHIGSPSHRL